MRQSRRNYRQANKGRALEQLIEIANRQYRARGIAVVHKVPTEWLPIRDGSGKVVSAKVTRKAIVDFVGTYRSAAIAFDAKESSAKSIRRDRVAPHQAQFLDDWERAGGLGFILVAFSCPHQHFVIPWQRWKGQGESPRLTLDELRQIPELAVKSTMRSALDYLEAVDLLWTERFSAEKVG